MKNLHLLYIKKISTYYRIREHYDTNSYFQELCLIQYGI